ncbi:MAG TPA: CBS domain-containing protein [Methanoculleus sp.]|nr:CBS domain-containing protein [Methanoculleus sp.]
MKACDIMTSPVYVVAPADHMAYVRNLMIKHRISRCPVLEATELKGMVTKKDLARGLHQLEPIWRRRPIDRIPVEMMMTPDPLTIKPGLVVNAIASLMVEHDISGIPVKKGDEIVGIVTKSDIMHSKTVQDLSVDISRLMHPAETISRYHSLDHVLDLMNTHNDKIVVVNNNGTLAGIITESNVAFFTYMDKKRRLPEKHVKMLRSEEIAGRKMLRDVIEVSAIAEDVMTRPVITIAPDAPISEVVTLMNEHSINSVVVAQDNDLKGIVKRDDIIKEVAK